MEIFKKTSFWILSCIIAYSLGILLFWTIDNIFNESTDKIAAFGAILGAVGAFFTGFVAIFIFCSWKYQSNQLTFKDEAKILFFKINLEIHSNGEISNLISKIVILEYIEIKDGKRADCLEEITFFINDAKDLIKKLKNFQDLTSDPALKESIKTHQKNLKTYSDYFEKIESESRFPYGNEFSQTEKMNRDNLKNSMEALKKLIKNYLLLR